MNKIQALQDRGVFLGGHPRLFDLSAQMTLGFMLMKGLKPESKVLDIGCGCLRTGNYFIRFLQPNSYFGIEPNTQMLQAGKEVLLDPLDLSMKNPSFSDNSDFNLSVFNQVFDFVIARSIWSHCTKAHIIQMLEGFKANSHSGSQFIASFLPARFPFTDYAGDKWIGRSHEDDVPGVVRHRLSWIQNQCRLLGLQAELVRSRDLNFGNQKWIVVTYLKSPNQ